MGTPLKIHFSVPAVPPSLNHYVKHTRMGIHYKTAEAKKFEELLALYAGDRRGKKFEATSIVLEIVLGPKMRGDVDNFPKVVLDSMVKCGVIRSDASITHLTVTKCRGAEAKTSIWIE